MNYERFSFFEDLDIIRQINQNVIDLHIFIVEKLIIIIKCLRLNGSRVTARIWREDGGLVMWYIQWLLSDSMDKRSMLLRGFPVILLVPTVE